MQLARGKTKEQNINRMLETIGCVVIAATAWWTAQAEVPRPEHPRPQFERAEWVNLNGDMWTYEFDFGCSGAEPGRELYRAKGFGVKQYLEDLA